MLIHKAKKIYAAVTFGSPNIARKKHKRPKWNNVMAETEISKIPLNACHIKLWKEIFLSKNSMLILLSKQKHEPIWSNLVSLTEFLVPAFDHTEQR